jgi:hypothetical protein
VCIYESLRSDRVRSGSLVSTSGNHKHGKQYIHYTEQCINQPPAYSRGIDIKEHVQVKVRAVARGHRALNCMHKSPTVSEVFNTSQRI